MKSKKELIRQWRLYVIADREAAAGRPLEALVRSAIDGGADVVQYRDKNASDADFLNEAVRLRRVTADRRIPLIVNDRIWAARESGADGVHLGQDDAGLAEARKILGVGAIVGRSTHSPDQGEAAEREGFDYIGVGPVFATPTKPDYRPAGIDYVRYAAEHLKIPFVAIGGIDGTNIREVCRAGAKTVAVVRAVAGAEDPAQAAKQLKALILSKI